MKKTMVITSVLSLALLYPAAAQAQPRAERPITNVMGSWAGSNSGFEAGIFVKREVRYTITSVNGQTFAGTKSWRTGSGEWSEGEKFQGVVHKTGQFMTSDEDGIFIGELVSRNRITGTYLEVGADAAALATTLTRQKSG